MRTECCLKIPDVEVRDGKELNGSMALLTGWLRD